MNCLAKHRNVKPERWNFMPITLFLDHERRISNYEISGPVSGEVFVAFMGEALRRNPEIADYDAICDATAYTGDITTDHMASVAMLMNDFRASPDGLAHTAMISLDSGFASWAQVMGHQFERRRFGVFSSRAAAEAWLQSARRNRDAA